MDKYHWSLILFAVLYILAVLATTILRMCFDRPLPREATAGIVAVLVVVALVRFCCCVTGTQDCPLTIGGMKQTTTIMVATIILLTLFTFDVPMANVRTKTNYSERPDDEKESNASPTDIT